MLVEITWWIAWKVQKLKLLNINFVVVAIHFLLTRQISCSGGEGMLAQAMLEALSWKQQNIAC